MIHRVDTIVEAKAKGRYDQWQANMQDPRFLRAVLERADREQAQAKAAARKSSAAKAAPAAG